MDELVNKPLSVEITKRAEYRFLDLNQDDLARLAQIIRSNYSPAGDEIDVHFEITIESEGEKRIRYHDASVFYQSEVPSMIDAVDIEYIARNSETVAGYKRVDWTSPVLQVTLRLSSKRRELITTLPRGHAYLNVSGINAGATLNAFQMLDTEMKSRIRDNSFLYCALNSVGTVFFYIIGVYICLRPLTGLSTLGVISGTIYSIIIGMTLRRIVADPFPIVEFSGRFKDPLRGRRRLMIATLGLVAGTFLQSIFSLVI